MSDFNWVQARAECSLVRVFERLKLELEQDVETRNALRSEGSAYRFALVKAARKLTVVREGNRISSSVIFEVTDYAIVAKKVDDSVIVEATVGLNDEGECKLKFRGLEDRELWHLRKLVLEDFFFNFSK